MKRKVKTMSDKGVLQVSDETLEIMKKYYESQAKKTYTGTVVHEIKFSSKWKLLFNFVRNFNYYNRCKSVKIVGNTLEITTDAIIEPKNDTQNS